MLEAIGAKILDWMGRSVKYMVWLSVASGLLLFLPSKWLAAVRVEQFVEDHGHWVGALFITSAVFVIIDLLHRLGNWIETLWLKQKTVRELKMLTLHERRLLMPYVESQRQTATFSEISREVVSDERER